MRVGPRGGWGAACCGGRRVSQLCGAGGGWVRVVAARQPIPAGIPGNRSSVLRARGTRCDRSCRRRCGAAHEPPHLSLYRTGGATTPVRNRSLRLGGTTRRCTRPRAHRQRSSSGSHYTAPSRHQRRGRRVTSIVGQPDVHLVRVRADCGPSPTKPEGIQQPPAAVLQVGVRAHPPMQVAPATAAKHAAAQRPRAPGSCDTQACIIRALRHGDRSADLDGHFLNACRAIRSWHGGRSMEICTRPSQA